MWCFQVINQECAHPPKRGRVLRGWGSQTGEGADTSARLCRGGASRGSFLSLHERKHVLCRELEFDSLGNQFPHQIAASRANGDLVQFLLWQTKQVSV